VTDEPFWPFPDPSRRAAEQELLEAEHEVVRAVEALAPRRRSLPPGRPARDHILVEGPRAMTPTTARPPYG